MDGLGRSIGVRIAVAAAVAAALAACTSTAPYPTAPAKAVERGLTQSGQSASRAFGFCYNNRANSPDQLMAEARLACPKGEVTYYGTDVLWTPCALFQPARATFVCTKTPSSETPPAK
jgi:hypothetical protein